MFSVFFLRTIIYYRHTGHKFFLLATFVKTMWKKKFYTLNVKYVWQCSSLIWNGNLLMLSFQQESPLLHLHIIKLVFDDSFDASRFMAPLIQTLGYGHCVWIWDGMGYLFLNICFKCFNRPMNTLFVNYINFISLRQTRLKLIFQL